MRKITDFLIDSCKIHPDLFIKVTNFNEVLIRFQNTFEMSVLPFKGSHLEFIVRNN